MKRTGEGRPFIFGNLESVAPSFGGSTYGVVIQVLVGSTNGIEKLGLCCEVGRLPCLSRAKSKLMIALLKFGWVVLARCNVSLNHPHTQPFLSLIHI